MKIRETLRKLFNARTIFSFIFITMVLSTIYVAIHIFYAPSLPVLDKLGIRVKGDYTLMLVQCLFGTFALLLPSFLERRLKITIPSGMLITYSIFLYLSIYLGDVRSFYYSVPHWDTILHTFSGVMLSALGFTVISILNNNNKVPVVLSPLFISIAAFCFSVALGVFWEIYEFSIDTFFHTNMQKFALENGNQLLGQAAVADTMKDLIVTCIGAFIFSAIGNYTLKRKNALAK